MPRYPLNNPIGVGDVMVTREGNKLISLAIRAGAALAGLPAYCNHAIIVHHRDASGRWWGIEGRPSGVGYVELGKRLDHPLTNINTDQPKTEDQRYLIAVAAESLLSIPYDWSAIRRHTEAALKVSELLSLLPGVPEWDENEIPTHVVCSSFADWAYERVGLANPGGHRRTRMTTPGHWDDFMLRRQWESP